MFSFVDGFTGTIRSRLMYQMLRILISRLLRAISAKTVMLFVLKNACVIYKPAMTVIFHNVLHDCLEDNVDVIIFKTIITDKN